MLSLDLYRQPFPFLLPDNQQGYRSGLGAILSLFTILLLVAYGTWKLIELSRFDEFSVQSKLSENHYSSVDKISFQEEDFMVAAAITSFDGSSATIEDPTIGTLEFY